MYISTLKLHNFKSFKGDHTISFSQHINFFVGNNNAGKTSIFHAIEFLTRGRSRDDFIFNQFKDDYSQYVSVEIELSDVGEYLPTKYQNYVNDNKLRLRRSSNKEIVSQNGKDVELNIKKIAIWNTKNNQFENPAGIDKTISEFFDIQSIYAELHNEDLQNFSNTKLTGKLIDTVSEEFKTSPAYKQFTSAHEAAFGQDGLLKDLKSVEEKISNTISKQFNNTKIKFKFDTPSITELYKNGHIEASSGEDYVRVDSHGNGMQRALALALIQVFAEVTKKTSIKSNMMYLIDEPEIYMHPLSQDKLLESLRILSNTSQIFITTHSPYILRHINPEYDSVKIFSLGTNKRFYDMEQLRLSNANVGEITYRAFGVPTIDLHQHLFSMLYMNWIDDTGTDTNHSIKDFDNYLSENGLQRSVLMYPRMHGRWKEKKEVTYPYFVRNVIDHPELIDTNTDDHPDYAAHNKQLYNDDVLKKSIEELYKMF